MSGTPAATPEEIALAQISKEKWEAYKRDFFPVEEQLAETANTDFSSLLRKRAKADIAQNVDRAAFDALRNTFKSGATPGSGRFNAVNTAGGATRGLADAAGGVAADLEAKKFQDSLRLNTLGLGMGLDADALSSLSRAGNTATNTALNKARDKFQNNQDLISAGILGTGLGANSLTTFLDRRKDNA